MMLVYYVYYTVQHSKSIYSCTNHDHWIIIKGCILSWVAGASEEGPEGPRRSELYFKSFPISLVIYTTVKIKSVPNNEHNLLLQLASSGPYGPLLARSGYPGIDAFFANSWSYKSIPCSTDLSKLA